ncbi:MAG: hypothetical protein ACPG7F_11130 [Aggregatilineales bacterium]
MSAIQTSKQEKNLLATGGLAGILGSVVFIIVFIIVGVFVGEDPIELEAWLTRFPDIRTARIFENGLYLLVLILWIPHTLALYYTLKSRSLAPALFGAAITIGGLLIIAAGALPHIATTQLSDLYYAADATDVDQATIVLMWQGTWAIFDALLIAGLAFIPFAFMNFGVAMRQHPDFGSIYSGLSFILGILGFGAIGMSMVDPNSPVAAVVIFGMIIFHFVIGWKLIRLSRRTR